MAETLGSRARKRRKELNKTLAEMAKAAGMSPGFLSDLEQDRSKGTTRLNALAAALGLHIDYLETGRGPPLASTPSGLYAVKSPVSTYRVLGHDLTGEALEFAEEWNKLEEPARSQILVMVESLVAAQIRKKRRADKPKPLKSSRHAPN
jgi:transcriptional regulator with XRE-family HTH domain